jgi:hypothetical protein
MLPANGSRNAAVSASGGAKKGLFSLALMAERYQQQAMVEEDTAESDAADIAPDNSAFATADYEEDAPTARRARPQQPQQRTKPTSSSSSRSHKESAASGSRSRADSGSHTDEVASTASRSVRSHRPSGSASAAAPSSVTKSSRSRPPQPEPQQAPTTATPSTAGVGWLGRILPLVGLSPTAAASATTVPSVAATHSAARRSRQRSPSRSSSSEQSSSPASEDDSADAERAVHRARRNRAAARAEAAEEQQAVIFSDSISLEDHIANRDGEEESPRRSKPSAQPSAAQPKPSSSSHAGSSVSSKIAAVPSASTRSRPVARTGSTSGARSRSHSNQPRMPLVAEEREEDSEISLHAGDDEEDSPKTQAVPKKSKLGAVLAAATGKSSEPERPNSASPNNDRALASTDSAGSSTTSTRPTSPLSASPGPFGRGGGSGGRERRRRSLLGSQEDGDDERDKRRSEEEDDDEEEVIAGEDPLARSQKRARGGRGGDDAASARRGGGRGADNNRKLGEAEDDETSERTKAELAAKFSKHPGSAPKPTTRVKSAEASVSGAKAVKIPPIPGKTEANKAHTEVLIPQTVRPRPPASVLPPSPKESPGHSRSQSHSSSHASISPSRSPSSSPPPRGGREIETTTTTATPTKAQQPNPAAAAGRRSTSMGEDPDAVARAEYDDDVSMHPQQEPAAADPLGLATTAATPTSVSATRKQGESFSSSSPSAAATSALASAPKPRRKTKKKKVKTESAAQSARRAARRALLSMASWSQLPLEAVVRDALLSKRVTEALLHIKERLVASARERLDSELESQREREKSAHRGGASGGEKDREREREREREKERDKLEKDLAVLNPIPFFRRIANQLVYSMLTSDHGAGIDLVASSSWALRLYKGNVHVFLHRVAYETTRRGLRAKIIRHFAHLEQEKLKAIQQDPAARVAPRQLQIKPPEEEADGESKENPGGTMVVQSGSTTGASGAAGLNALFSNESEWEQSLEYSLWEAEEKRLRVKLELELSRIAASKQAAVNQQNPKLVRELTDKAKQKEKEMEQQSQNIRNKYREAFDAYSSPLLPALSPMVSSVQASSESCALFSPASIAVSSFLHELLLVLEHAYPNPSYATTFNRASAANLSRIEKETVCDLVAQREALEDAKGVFAAPPSAATAGTGNQTAAQQWAALKKRRRREDAAHRFATKHAPYEFPMIPPAASRKPRSSVPLSLSPLERKFARESLSGAPHGFSPSSASSSSPASKRGEISAGAGEHDSPALARSRAGTNATAAPLMGTVLQRSSSHPNERGAETAVEGPSAAVRSRSGGGGGGGGEDEGSVVTLDGVPRHAEPFEALASAASAAAASLALSLSSAVHISLTVHPILGNIEPEPTMWLKGKAGRAARRAARTGGSIHAPERPPIGTQAAARGSVAGTQSGGVPAGTPAGMAARGSVAHGHGGATAPLVPTPTAAAAAAAAAAAFAAGLPKLERHPDFVSSSDDDSGGDSSADSQSSDEEQPSRSSARQVSKAASTTQKSRTSTRSSATAASSPSDSGSESDSSSSGGEESGSSSDAESDSDSGSSRSSSHGVAVFGGAAPRSRLATRCLPSLWVKSKSYQTR